MVRSLNDAGVYWVEGIKNGCIVRDSIKVEYKTCCIPSIIPNIITPNLDGKNDFFEFECIVGSGWEILIVNRWGNIVYKNENYMNEWNGKGCATGTYYYTLENRKEDRRYT